MAELVITVRDMYTDTLEAWAELEWRTPEQQACAILEQALNARRVRSNAPDKPRGKPGRRANGVDHAAVTA